MPPDSAGSPTPFGGTPSPQSNIGGCDHSRAPLKLTRAPENWARLKSTVPAENWEELKSTVPLENWAEKLTVPPEKWALMKPHGGATSAP